MLSNSATTSNRTNSMLLYIIIIIIITGLLNHALCEEQINSQISFAIAKETYHSFVQCLELNEWVEYIITFSFQKKTLSTQFMVCIVTTLMYK